MGSVAHIFLNGTLVSAVMISAVRVVFGLSYNTRHLSITSRPNKDGSLMISGAGVEMLISIE